MKRAAVSALARLVREEIGRAMELVRSKGHPSPYYISQLVRHEESWELRAKYGTLDRDNHSKRRDCLCDVRVGSYRYDQVQEGGLNDNDKEDESYDYVALPVGDQPDGIRHALWRITESRYREAAENLLRKKSHEITYLNTNARLRSFEKREPVEDLSYQALPDVDVEAWKRFVLSASKEMKKYPRLGNSHVELYVRNATRVFGNSEGTLLTHGQTYWTLEVYLWYLSDKGDAFPYSVNYFVTDPSELPSARTVRKEIAEAHALLEQIANAPVLHSFCGPALLDPVPAGLLVHEAIGHRLEGSRLLSSGEGQTFRDAIGEDVLPEYLSLRDDPRLTTYAGKSLAGHYPYDDEGVPATEARLIEDGVLRDFLTTRMPVPGGKGGAKQTSNGHARSRHHQRAVSRMGVTILEAKDGLGDAEMKALLLKEIREQGAPFGIHIRRADGGETSTEAYDFQAFLGEIQVAAKVYPDGREELIRGVDFVGTPLHAIRNIIAAGSRAEVDNAYCGAESGYVPVSTIAPSLLLSELELQAKSDTPYTQYTYPIPWSEEKGSSGDAS